MEAETDLIYLHRDTSLYHIFQVSTKHCTNVSELSIVIFLHLHYKLSGLSTVLDFSQEILYNNNSMETPR